MRGAASLIYLLLAAQAASAIELEDCRLESEVTRGAVNARCGYFETAENPSDATATSPGRRIRIHVAVIPALSRQSAPDPLFIVSGGPGQAASDFYLASAAAFERVRRSRDLVLIDQRGTGRSNRLDCATPDELESARFEAELIARVARDCLKSLNGDPRFYTTSVAVRDLEAIRAALGFRTINLYGISYGTRVVQHYVRRYPAQVRAVVLDGIVPPQTALGPDVALAAQRALDAIFKRCESSTTCRERFPNIGNEFSALRARLAKSPLSLSVPDPSTAQLREFEFGALHLAIAMRMHSYSDDTAALLPYLIHEANVGRPHALAAQALMLTRDIDKQMANGMHNAVVCTEDVPFFTQTSLSNPALERAYLQRVFVDSLQATCAVWPKGEIDAEFHAPLDSATPALLLSGENDPVTPPEYGDLAARGFAHSKHVVVPGQGHGQVNNPCIARLIARFVEDGASAALDLSCVAQQAAAPFLLNAVSPGP